MDIDGFCVMTETEKNDYFSSFKKIIEHSEYYSFFVGTNEEIEYNNFSDFENDFTVEEITKEEAETLHKLFQGTFGFIPDVGDALENLEDDEFFDDEEEDDEE